MVRGMSSIGPGDWVERIAENMPASYVIIVGHAVYPGGVYQVRDVSDYLCRERGREAGLRLVGVIASTSDGSHIDGWWPAHKFRPIYRPKPELIETLLKSADEPVREDA